MLDEIIKLLTRYAEGLTARQIAKILNVDKGLVNSVLYAYRNKYFSLSTLNYVWTMIDQKVNDENNFDELKIAANNKDSNAMGMSNEVISRRSVEISHSVSHEQMTDSYSTIQNFSNHQFDEAIEAINNIHEILEMILNINPTAYMHSLPRRNDISSIEEFFFWTDFHIFIYCLNVYSRFSTTAFLINKNEFNLVYSIIGSKISSSINYYSFENISLNFLENNILPDFVSVVSLFDESFFSEETENLLKSMEWLGKCLVRNLDDRYQEKASKVSDNIISKVRKLLSDIYQSKRKSEKKERKSNKRPDKLDVILSEESLADFSFSEYGSRVGECAHCGEIYPISSFEEDSAGHLICAECVRKQLCKCNRCHAIIPIDESVNFKNHHLCIDCAIGIGIWVFN